MLTTTLAAGEKIDEDACAAAGPMPAAYFSRPLADRLAPCRRLAVAILSDMEMVAPGTDQARDDDEWLAQDPETTTLGLVCALLEIDPAHLRRRVPALRLGRPKMKRHQTAGSRVRITAPREYR